VKASKLGKGARGPWEDCSAEFVKMARAKGNPDVVGGYRNRTFVVQRRQYEAHPGIDLLTVSRHDGGNVHPGWSTLQAVKEALAPNGPNRFGLEIFPPARFVVDNRPMWHVWVMPIGWQPGFGFHSEQDGGGLKI
jgi:hypothetical protein